MNKFRPIQYLKKYTFLIIALFVFLTLGMYMVLRSLQTYTATTIIDYVYGDAENGLAPDGTELDTTGIYSSSVISQALDNLGLDQGKYPIDSIRAEIKVQQIADDAVDVVNEAKNKEGETSDLQSTKYAISYKADSSNGADMARAVLDEIMDGYFTQFSKPVSYTHLYVPFKFDEEGAKVIYYEPETYVPTGTKREISDDVRYDDFQEKWIDNTPKLLKLTAQTNKHDKNQAVYKHQG